MVPGEDRAALLPGGGTPETAGQPTCGKRGAARLPCALERYSRCLHTWAVWQPGKGQCRVHRGNRRIVGEQLPGRIYPVIQVRKPQRRISGIRNARLPAQGGVCAGSINHSLPRTASYSSGCAQATVIASRCRLVISRCWSRSALRKGQDWGCQSQATPATTSWPHSAQKSGFNWAFMVVSVRLN